MASKENSFDYHERDLLLAVLDMVYDLIWWPCREKSYTTHYIDYDSQNGEDEFKTLCNFLHLIFYVNMH